MPATGAAIWLFSNSEVSNPGNNLEKYGSGGLALPVAPLESVSIAENIIVNTETLPHRGMVAFGGGKGATQINVRTLFPLEPQSAFVHGHIVNMKYPSEYDTDLKELAQTNCVFRLVIADASAPSAQLGKTANTIFDDYVLIQSYNTLQAEGADIEASIEFIQWQKVLVRKVRLKGQSSNRYSDRKGKYTRPGKKPRPARVKGSEGQKKKKKGGYTPVDLRAIAIKYYDTAKAWKFIAGHKKNIAKFGVKSGKKKVAIKNFKHKNLKRGTVIYLPDSTEKTANGKTFWAITGVEE